VSFRPKGWQSLAAGGTRDEERLARVCECDVCTKEGPHEPMCDVHWEPPRLCNCPKRDEKKESR
jgi:hypothetical protein